MRCEDLDDLRCAQYSARYTAQDRPCVIDQAVQTVVGIPCRTDACSPYSYRELARRIADGENPNGIAVFDPQHPQPYFHFIKSCLFALANGRACRLLLQEGYSASMHHGMPCLYLAGEKNMVRRIPVRSAADMGLMRLLMDRRRQVIKRAPC